MPEIYKRDIIKHTKFSKKGAEVKNTHRGWSSVRRCTTSGLNQGSRYSFTTRWQFMPTAVVLQGHTCTKDQPQAARM
ncbi:hypothetical protein CEXT_89251 [Caerostris extrusa]|uniref:Uncharacterized protein n=1 Tax=Caerostris extrusa TaxID=172846 RepID=A0AAV4UH80_CAEEX|nr:hypothetical protein CEXT_89251 [Caerostris extrusa]